MPALSRSCVVVQQCFGVMLILLEASLLTYNYPCWDTCCPARADDIMFGVVSSLAGLLVLVVQMRTLTWHGSTSRTDTGIV